MTEQIKSRVPLNALRTKLTKVIDETAVLSFRERAITENLRP